MEVCNRGDYATALQEFRPLAEQGDAKAQNNLGTMYGTGRGVPINDVRAYMWYSLAKAQGHEAAADNLEIAKSLMTPAQITKAQALASEM